MITLRAYRMRFQNENGEHIWNTYDDKQFLEMLGGYRKDRNKGIEGLTLAGLMMFGKGLVVRDVFDNLFMEYRDESHKTDDVVGMTVLHMTAHGKTMCSISLEKCFQSSRQNCQSLLN